VNVVDVVECVKQNTPPMPRRNLNLGQSLVTRVSNSDSIVSPGKRFLACLRFSFVLSQSRSKFNVIYIYNIYYVIHAVFEKLLSTRTSISIFVQGTELQGPSQIISYRLYISSGESLYPGFLQLYANLISGK
jgi:hypothetical protein